MPRSFGVVFVVALVTWALLGMLVSEALANHVTCGDVITTDTTLDSDLLDCPGHGIVIGAPGITLDLNGHTVDGDGDPRPRPRVRHRDRERAVRQLQAGHRRATRRDDPERDRARVRTRGAGHGRRSQHGAPARAGGQHGVRRHRHVPDVERPHPGQPRVRQQQHGHRGLRAGRAHHDHGQSHEPQRRLRPRARGRRCRRPARAGTSRPATARTASSSLAPARC